MSAALDLLERVPSVLIFLAALTVVAECASVTGLFDLIGDTMVRLAHGRVRIVWLLHMGAAALVTAFLSLDTTAVLMTSAAVVVARRVQRPVATFAFPTLWIANMASMWLPSSNLTNLLARDVLSRPSPLAFLAESWPVALTTTLVPLAVAGVIWRKQLSGLVATTAPTRERQCDHLRTAVGVIVALMCGALLLIEPAVAASVAAALSVAVIAIGRCTALREVRIPWRSMGITALLFVGVALVHGSGVLNPMLGELGHWPAWSLAAVGAIVANGANNLPAYLALEPAAHGDTHRLLALLVGVNVASGLTWWGSIATLLWRERLRRDDVRITWGTHLRLTGVATAVTCLAAVAVLELTHG